MMAYTRQIAAAILVSFVAACGVKPNVASRSPEELSVLAKSSFFKGELAASNTDGGFIPNPGTGAGSDSGVIAAPGGSSAGTTTPTTPTSPSTPSTPGGGVVQSPTTPTQPSVPGTAPSVPTAPSTPGTSTPPVGPIAGPTPGASGDGGTIAPPANGGSDTGTIPPGGGVVQNPTTPSTPSNPTTPSVPGTTPPGGGGVAQNPSTPSNPSNPGGGVPPTVPTVPGSPGDGGVVQNPTNPTPGNPADGGVVQNPPTPANPGDTGSTQPPSTNPPGGGVVQNPPSTPGSVPPGGGVVLNPPGTLPPSGTTPTNPSTPTTPGAPGDGGVVQNPPTPPGTNPPDGGVVQNPPTTPGANPPGGGTTNPPTPPGGPVVVNPPTTPGGSNPPGGTTPPGSTNPPTTPGGPVVVNPPGTPGDGGTIPGTPATPGGTDGGTKPCTDPSVCPGFDVVLNRVCSERRSAIPYPKFVFFEEARKPILTFESQINSCTDTSSRSLASVGGGMPAASQSRLLNVLFNPAKKGPSQIALAKKDLKDVNLLKGKYKTRLTMAINEIKAWFPQTWRSIYVKASVCEDSNGDGFCYGEIEPYQLLATSYGFRLGQVPRTVSLMVWNGRTRNIWDDPKMCEQQISPLVLDLNGDGFNFSSAENGVYFDLNDDGNPVLSAWTVSKDDAFLVRDINGNGRIDSGAELFGSATRLNNGARAANGFAALRELDSDANGLFDSQDREWGNLRLWVDRNRDGIANRGELYTLDAAKIESISLNDVSAMEVDGYGNETRQRAVYRRKVGGISTLRQIIDIWFHTLNVE